MAPFKVLRLDHLVLRVRDMEVSVAFYTGVLGLTVARNRPELQLVHLRAGDSMLDLVAVDGPLGKAGGAAPGMGGHNLDHLCLRVDAFDESALQKHFAALGLPAPQAAASRFGAEGQGPSLYIRDPDGNTIELKGPSMDPQSRD